MIKQKPVFRFIRKSEINGRFLYLTLEKVFTRVLVELNIKSTYSTYDILSVGGYETNTVRFFETPNDYYPFNSYTWTEKELPNYLVINPPKEDYTEMVGDILAILCIRKFLLGFCK